MHGSLHNAILTESLQTLDRWGVETPWCPKYRGVAKLDPLKIQNKKVITAIIITTGTK